jgi:hypothetical protein
MPKYLIERNVPNAGKLSGKDLQAMAAKSCEVLETMGPSIQWQHSYVVGDKLYCVYIAPNEEMIREHAMRGNFPANSVMRVSTIIDPTTRE